MRGNLEIENCAENLLSLSLSLLFSDHEYNLLHIFVLLLREEHNGASDNEELFDNLF